MNRAWLVALVVYALGCSSSAPPALCSDDDCGDSGSAAGSGVGGAAGVAGALVAGSGGSGGCDYQIRSCNYETVLHPDTISMKDKQSNLTEVGYYCESGNGNQPTWVTEQLCTYSEECLFDTSNQPACTPCGDPGRRVDQRWVDNVLVNDSQGCVGPGWNVSGCSSDSSIYGLPYAYLSYQHDTDVLVFAITTDGKLHTTFQNLTVTTSNLSMNIAPNGLVEFDIVADYDLTDSYQMMHHWHLAGHIAGDCPAQ